MESEVMAHHLLHGILLKDSALPLPVHVAACSAEARPGFTSGTADEFEDVPESLSAKMKVLAALVRSSRRCVAYTGAGLSTSAGIGDYASKAVGSIAPSLRRDEKEWPSLQPTVAHRALTAMYHAGFLHGWVQQNHDGLPQKAGLPQDAINEIHGTHA